MTLTAEHQTDVWLVAPQEAGRRIDQLLSDHYPGFSRTYFQKLVGDGFVLLNDEPVKKRIAPEAGDAIEVCFRIESGPDLAPEAIPLDILFEDEHLIAVNKPAGMVVHPAPGHWSGTFVNALLAHCQDLPPSSHPLRPGIVHRLDKNTSGILIAAKTAVAHQNLVRMFAERQMEKIYLAICIGHVPDTTVCAPIGRHRAQRKEMTVADHGKVAESLIQTLAFRDPLSLALIRPKTGRTHQIRVHLQHLGHPVLGDPVYGHKRLNDLHNVPRPLLHAWRLNFCHPVAHARLSLLAPLPLDFRERIQWMAPRAIDLVD